MAMHSVNDDETFSSILRESFKTTYYPVGYNPVTGKFSDGTMPRSSVKNEPFDAYLNDPLTLFTSFMGWTNRKTVGDHPEQSLKNILLYNFLGWQPNASLPVSIFNAGIVKPIIVVLWNILTWLPRFALNIVKLGGEFLPRLLDRSLKLLITKYSRFDAALREDFSFQREQEFPVVHLAGAFLAMAGSFALLGIMKTLRFGVATALFVSMALCSPLLAMERAGYLGSRAGEWLAKKISDSETLKETLSWIGGGALVTLSAAITSVAALIIFNLAVGVALSHMPIHWLVKVYDVIGPALDKIGAIASRIPFVPSIASVMGTTPGFVGIGLGIGVIFTTVGFGLSVLVTKLTERWSKNAKPDPEVVPAPVPVVGKQAEKAAEKSQLLNTYEKLNALQRQEEERIDKLREEALAPSPQPSCLAGVLGMFSGTATSSAEPSVYIEPEESNFVRETPSPSL